MKKALLIICCLVFLFQLSAQQNVRLENLRKVFVSGTISDKTEALEAAVVQTGTEELIRDGLQFAQTYATLLGHEQPMITLAATAVKYALKYDSMDTARLVASLFSVYDAKEVKQYCLGYFLKTRYIPDGIIESIDSYALELLNEGSSDNKEIMLDCVNTLDRLHGTSSFKVLFSYAASSFVDRTTREAAVAALSRLSSVYRDNMLSYIEDDFMENKLVALQLILSNSENSDSFRAEAAEKALSVSIIHVGDTYDAALSELQLTAVRELKRLSWTRSADLVAEWFATARTEYEVGMISSTDFIEIIYALKELSVVKAGGILTDLLSSLNTAAENGNSYSQPLVLAVINTLGELGDKVSFDALLYVTYLPYPEKIIQASREALARLKW